MEEWITVCENKVRKDAESKFEEWKQKNIDWFNRLNIEEDIMIDTIFSSDKISVTRYRVKKK